MTDDRLLMYQPNHGFGVELWVFHTATRIAQITNRRLVVPRVQLLEQHRYIGGYDELFEMPVIDWTTTDSVLRQQPRPAELVRLIPAWRQTYRDPRTRDAHPVWVDNIERCIYFRLLGLAFDTRHTLMPDEPITPSQAKDMLSSDASLLCISFLSGLLSDESLEPDRLTDFDNRMFTPPSPRRNVVESVIAELDGPPSLAVHLREGARVPARTLRRIELPPLDEYASHIAAADDVYVASDSDEAFRAVARYSPAVRRLYTPRDASASAYDLALHDVREMSACVAADRFVGTWESTFSQYIAYARSQMGHDPTTTTLLGRPTIAF